MHSIYIYKETIFSDSPFALKASFYERKLFARNMEMDAK